MHSALHIGICKAHEPPKPPKPDASPALQPVQPIVQPAVPVQPLEAQASQAAPQPQTVSPALHPKISPPAQAGFKCCFILKFLALWRLSKFAYLCLVSMSECLQLKLQVAGFSKFFQRITGNITVQEDHKEAWSDWKLILATAAAAFDTWISLEMAVMFALLFPVVLVHRMPRWLKRKWHRTSNEQCQNPTPQLSWVCSNHDP